MTLIKVIFEVESAICMKKQECTGCGACYNACSMDCIIMKRDFDGCLYPAINKKKCIECGKCKAVCPVRSKKNSRTKSESTVVYAGYCKKEAIRNTSSSGGIYPMVAEWIVAERGIVFGACYEDNMVVHASAVNKEGIEKFKGSKYVQSNIKRTYREAEEALKQGKKVLFTALPCQIEGLKSYLGKEYENLYTIDLICHGVGSPLIWKKYLEVFHGKKEIKSIDFKNKEKGWNQEQFVITYADGNRYIKNPMEDCYTYGFNTNVFLRPSCYQCKFKGVHRNSDITIGDAWGVERYVPKFRDNRGCSVIFIHSKKGTEIFDAIKEDLICTQVEADKVIRYNQRMITSVPMNSYREFYFNDLKRFPFRIVMKRMMKRDRKV